MATIQRPQRCPKCNNIFPAHKMREHKENCVSLSSKKKSSVSNKDYSQPFINPSDYFIDKIERGQADGANLKNTKKSKGFRNH